MTFEEFRDAWHDRERAADADMRVGIIAGEQTRYRYVGPPLVLTPDAEIERAWLQAVQVRAHAFEEQILASSMRRPVPMTEEEAEALVRMGAGVPLRW